LNEQKEINRFLDKILGDKKRIQIEKYRYINTQVSSEMVLSILQLLQDKLPCS